MGTVLFAALVIQFILLGFICVDIILDVKGLKHKKGDLQVRKSILISNVLNAIIIIIAIFALLLAYFNLRFF